MNSTSFHREKQDVSLGLSVLDLCLFDSPCHALLFFVSIFRASRLCILKGSSAMSPHNLFACFTYNDNTVLDWLFAQHLTSADQ